MGQFNGKKMYAIKAKFNKEFPDLPELPGIYLWTRKDLAINKVFYYVGQAKNLKNRRFDYYKLQTGLAYPTRHFENSLKVHKDGQYEIIEYCAEKDLDEREKYGIDYYAKKDNYITRNDSLTGRDVVTSNKKRIDKIERKYINEFKKLLSKVNIDIGNHQLHIYTKENKDGVTLNKTSHEAYKQIANFIKKLINETN